MTGRRQYRFPASGQTPGALRNLKPMDVSAEAENALAQPTRARLFSLLSDLRRAAPTDELAELLGRHPNGVRQHLERLRDAGLVSSKLERRGRGRPRDLWSISPNAEPGGRHPTAYAELSRWLTLAIDGGPVEPEAIEARGHQIGLDLIDAGGDATDREARFHDALSAMGFQPQRQSQDSEQVTYCLGNCPYRDAVHERQAVICGLHRGITSGMVTTIAPDSELAAFEVKDPDRAGCVITIAGPIAARNE